jgi:hypothetical protein
MDRGNTNWSITPFTQPHVRERERETHTDTHTCRWKDRNKDRETKIYLDSIITGMNGQFGQVISILIMKYNCNLHSHSSNKREEA